MKKYIIILILIAIALAFLLPFNILLNFAHDDSFFYLKTADNISKGLGSTFDGINITNGYHPLYLILLVVIFFIPNLLFNPSPEIMYRVVILFHFVLVLYIVIFILKSFFNFYIKENNKQYLISIILLISILVGIRDFGVESHLLCIIMAIYFYIKTIEIKSEKIYYYIKPILFSLLFLARTDFFLLVIPFLLISDIIITEKDKRKKLLINYFLFLILTASSYYLFNYTYFHRIDTVSGYLTNGFPIFHLIGNIKYLISKDANIFNQFSRLIFCIGAIVSFIIYSFSGKKKDNPQLERILIGVGIGSLIFIIAHLCFNNYSLREWYLTFPSMIGAIMLSILISKLKKNQLLLNILLVIILIVAVYFSKITSNKFLTSYEYSKKINLTLNKNERVFQMDMCGLTGYFSERSIINGDGLVNSYEYLDVLKNRKLKDYLLENNIKYYSTYITKEINEKDSVFTDSEYTERGYGFDFKFQMKNLVLKESFQWHHLLKNSNGNWYLFKIDY